MARQKRIGLVGHRRNNLSVTELLELPDRLRALFAEIALAAGPAPVALLTGMADGTDLIGAGVRPPAWSLVAVLTEPPAVLARRMDSVDAAELLRLCAESSTILELLRGPLDDYDRQADIIVSRAELVVAVWDGERGRGRGGTADSISRAQALGRPVVVLPSAGGAARWVGRGRRTPVNASVIAGILGRV